ncbi:hypothetical protein F5144DRAFT_244630 [Chaetomium tenue]|uniref:Uncharacterized protein n=1 Tax=Chaetomium tenue TaxID=1854479 RepID=A0ACB7P8C6_9PEZI|nr:hypothetical protein F5144DRAFT_244630 [Chaetomium globosum]
MPGGKDRVYVALFWTRGSNPARYANQGAGESEEGRKQTDIFSPRYHWGFCICPKHENNGAITGSAYRVETMAGMQSLRDYPLDQVHNNPDRLLGRILIAKTGDKPGVENIISDPKYLGAAIALQTQWDERNWMAVVVQALKDDQERGGSVSSMIGQRWSYIRVVARRYVRTEIEHGRYCWPFDAKEPVPTLCLFENRVLTP